MLSGASNNVVGLYAVRRGAPFEPQTDLPPKTVTFQGKVYFLKSEVWLRIPACLAGTTRWEVSTHGRSQPWLNGVPGPRYTPRPTMSNGRAYICVNGNSMLVYRVIWQTFCPTSSRSQTDTVLSTPMPSGWQI